ncbi:unnamed protein product [Gadus morhua 'NCC']
MIWISGGPGLDSANKAGSPGPRAAWDGAPPVESSPVPLVGREPGDGGGRAPGDLGGGGAPGDGGGGGGGGGGHQETDTSGSQSDVPLLSVSGWVVTSGQPVMDCPTPVTSRSDFENHCHIFQLRVSHSQVLPAEPVPGTRGSSTRKFCRLAWNREKFETWLFLRAPLWCCASWLATPEHQSPPRNVPGREGSEPRSPGNRAPLPWPQSPVPLATEPRRPLPGLPGEPRLRSGLWVADEAVLACRWSAKH